MAFAKAILLGLAHFHLGAAIARSPAAIDTSSGRVQGFTDDITPNVAQYLGIPFAEQPVGPRRWLPPAPKKKSESNHSGEDAGAVLSNVWLTDAPEFIITPRDFQSEECLNLNVWAPLDKCRGEQSKKDLLPVLVWIYGGGFATGGPTVPYQVPARWVERSGEHIVVGITYRVNIFGFPNARALKSGEQNLGLLDQRLAVEWIRDNIRNFGGDPSRITLWGQSAGAISVDNYNFAYPEDPIASGYIMNSGNSLLRLQSNDVQHTNFTFVAKHFGCNTTTGESEIECLRGVSSVDIEKFLKQYSDSGKAPSLSFVQVVDNRTFFSNPTERTLAGNFSRKPAIIGTTDNEGSAFVPFSTTQAPNRTAADRFTADLFLCPAVQTTSSRYKANATTFRYLYSGNFSNIAPRPWEGACHSSDLPMYFGTYGIARGNGTQLERETSERMQDFYLAFAKDPVNGLPDMGWDAYEPEGEALLIAHGGQAIQKISQSKLESPCDGVKPNGKPLPPNN
ncbi:uncharacterized protein SETTUDRAFT_39633 [Exserohilum turcica Et28A]|uniref:Carboxylic ester hydrolase n=1 Tax=Exserohilum turcicum (strain 28A) TaxID=671987 RepID=R0IMB6_EXST2|nr:uncharacterized protein SETTUDRAFT_39633 [Exserohilum turcica Et28A]EOA86135.1 hypothetical protein SETTUDRAFT_39633 [Exserohilum turcica Et28A]